MWVSNKKKLVLLVKTCAAISIWFLPIRNLLWRSNAFYEPICYFIRLARLLRQLVHKAHVPTRAFILLLFCVFFFSATEIGAIVKWPLSRCRAVTTFLLLPPTEPHKENEIRMSIVPSSAEKTTFDYYLDNNDRTWTINKHDQINMLKMKWTENCTAAHALAISYSCHPTN